MYKASTLNRDRYHHGDLRAALIILALEEVEKNGPDRLSVSALAKRAGVSPMAPYRHFADKEALLEALARQGFEQLGATMREVDDTDAPLKAIVAFGVCYVEFALAHPGLFRLMFGRAPPTPDNGLSSDPSTMYGLFAARVASLVPPDRREDIFLAGWCLMHGLASLCVAGRIRGAQAEPADLARRMGNVLSQAIAGDAAKATSKEERKA